MRTLFLLLAALLGAAAANASEPRNSAYTSLTLSSPAACARACADDGICMAWSYRAENACDLSAVISSSAPSDAIASGLAARAPAFALRPVAAPAAAPVVEESQGISIAAEPDSEDDLVSAQLLGGPEDTDLRTRLGASQ